jgi:peptidyl-prolyl cis-trans isomerase C
MKSAPAICLTLASTLLIAAGCKKETDQKPGAAPAAKAPAAAADAAKPKDPNEVVASVNDAKYVRKDMDKVVDSLLKSQNIPAEQQAEARKYFEQRAIYSFVMKTLILAEAKKQNITTTEEDRKAQLAKMEEALKPQNKTVESYFKDSPLGEQAARAEFEDGLTIDKLLQKNVLDAIQVSDEDVKKVIAEIQTKNAALLDQNKNLDATNALKRAKILAIKKQLADGADFAELAKANSDCPSKEKGGDLGTFARGNMVKPFEDAAFTQEIGKVGDIVETQFGYHLIKVTAKSPAVEAKGDQPAKPETVTASHILIKNEQVQQPQAVPTVDQVTTHLKRQKQQEAVQKYLEGLKSAAKINTIFPDMPL